MKHGRAPNAELAERNNIILERWLKGEKLDAIGRTYGISRERIRQLVDKAEADSGDPSVVERAVSRRFSKVRDIQFQRTKRVAARQELKELFKTRFDRDEIIRILELDDDPDIMALPDEDLCALIYESVNVRRFFKYTRCSGCETVKVNDEFAKSVISKSYCLYCRKCNTDRHRQMMLDNPEIQRRSYLKQLTKPNKSRIYQLRHYYRSQGQEDKMPPLPPRGTPDSEIVVPKKQMHGEALKAWRESVGRTFNRAKAAEKAKQIVKEDALSRHIEL